MKKIVSGITLVLSLICVSILVFNFRPVKAATSSTLSIVFSNGHSTITAPARANFTVYINITNCPGIGFYDIGIHWDPSVLELKDNNTATDVVQGTFMSHFGTTAWAGAIASGTNLTAGNMSDIACGFMSPGFTATGNGTLFGVLFHAKTTNSSTIISIMTPNVVSYLLDPTLTTLVPIQATVNGQVNVSPTLFTLPFHDVAITDVITSNNFVYAGENVDINADVCNFGDFNETFNVTTYANMNTTMVGHEITIGTQSLSLLSEESTTLTFTWNTTGVAPGNYTISAFANVTQNAIPTDNTYTDGKIEIFPLVADINVTCPASLTLNPSIFTFNYTYNARLVNIGNANITSTGYEGYLEIVGSRNGTIRLCVSQPNVDVYSFYLPLNRSVQVPIWLMFQPTGGPHDWGVYNGNFTLQLNCGGHKIHLEIVGISIDVCRNGAYVVYSQTVTFTWTLTGGCWAYLEVTTNLPPGWTYTVDPPLGTLFETPHTVTVNITAPPDADGGSIGSVTLRAYENATGNVFWQFVYFASTSGEPPTIETVQPTMVTFNGRLQFNTTVEDVSGVQSAQLFYSVNNGPWNNQTMQWSSGDTFNSTSYIATLPHVPDNSLVKYYVVAKNWLGNQTQSDTKTITVRYDLAVTEVRRGRAVVGRGFLNQINATVANEGTLPNSLLKVAAYANTTLIGTQTIQSLPNGTETTLTFDWNTTNFAMGNYSITAYAIPILGETDTSNNILANGTVQITKVGDLGGGVPPTFSEFDGKVDGKDFALFLECYHGTAPPEVMYMADLGGGIPPQFFKCDGKVDGKDFALFLECYHGTGP